MAEPAAWYEEAFGREYLAVYPHRDLRTARAEAEALARQGVGGVVLDVCCGQGRHVLALRELGLSAFGVDLSAELLALSGELPGGARLAGLLARGDARALPFAGASFDAAVCLFTSFGYFERDGDRAALGEMARVLRPGGTAVLDLPNPERVRAELVSESRAVRGGVEILERRRLEEGGRRVVKDVRLIRPDGSVRAWRESVRLYDERELAELASQAGLALERLAGAFDGRAAAERAPRRIAWARARRA